MVDYASLYLISSKITTNKIIAGIVVLIVLIAIGLYYSRRARA